MTTTYRVSIELPNGSKFRAAGEVADVREDAEVFYAKLLNVPKPSTATTTTENIVTPLPHTNGNGNGNGGTETAIETQLPLSVDGLDRGTLDRLFSRDKHGTVALRALPSGENAASDALLALIYGADRLSNEQQVSGSRLMKAAVQSGLKSQVDRIDRFLNPYLGQFVTAAGFKKGRRYGLTNPGIRRAEEILSGILG